MMVGGFSQCLLSVDLDKKIEFADAPQVATKKPRGSPDIIVLENPDTKSNQYSDTIPSQTSICCSPSHSIRRANKKPAPPPMLTRSSSSRMWHSSRMPVSHLLNACTETTCNGFQTMLRYLCTDEIDAYRQTLSWGITLIATL